MDEQFFAQHEKDFDSNGPEDMAGLSGLRVPTETLEQFLAGEVALFALGGTEIVVRATREGRRFRAVARFTFGIDSAVDATKEPVSQEMHIVSGRVPRFAKTSWVVIDTLPAESEIGTEHDADPLTDEHE